MRPPQLRAYRAPAHPARPARIAFRAIAASDLDFLASLYAEVRAAELAPVAWPPEHKQAFLRQQFDLQHDYYANHYPGADRLVIDRADEPVGRVYVHRSPGDIRLMDLALREAVRGCGIGRALLAELIDEAERFGDCISLHVEDSNPAHAWYLRLGFEHREDRGVYQYLVRPPRAAAAPGPS